MTQEQEDISRLVLDLLENRDIRQQVSTTSWGDGVVSMYETRGRKCSYTRIAALFLALDDREGLFAALDSHPELGHIREALQEKLNGQQSKG